MSRHVNTESAKNKLLLLYLIDKINIPVSAMQITKIILENKYINYFFLNKFLKELVQSGFLKATPDNERTIYEISENGKKTLEYFTPHIPQGIKSSIDKTIKSIRKNIKNEYLIKADFEPQSETEFIVKCSVSEDDFSLIGLEILVGTKRDAISICENWRKNSAVIYQDIIDAVTKKRE